jgi:hypothetical protein
MITLTGYNIPSEIINIICSNCGDLTKYLLARTSRQFKLSFGNIILSDTYICKKAASIGSLEILKWARENDCHWDSYTCSYAAENGHLEILKWARKNGCDWDSVVCSNAACGGAR